MARGTAPTFCAAFTDKTPEVMVVEDSSVRMAVTVTKKYIKIKALEAEMYSSLAEIEQIKMSGGNEYRMGAVSSHMNYLAGEFRKLEDVDADGFPPKAKCPKCGWCYFGPEAKIEFLHCEKCGTHSTVKSPD